MDILGTLVQYGALGAVAAVSTYQTWIMTQKLFTIIENVTTTLSKLTATIETCQTIHRENIK